MKAVRSVQRSRGAPLRGTLNHFLHLRVAEALIVLSVAALATTAHAATFTVTNLNDSGADSFRAAITQANANAGTDDIVFDAALSGAISLTTDLPAITDNVTITGPGARNVTITGSSTRRVLVVNKATTISRLRLANGFADRGAGIRFNDTGTLTVTDCHFDQHLATVDGGAILLDQGSLVAERCTFTTCQAAGEGGVLFYGEGGGSPTVTLTNCTFVNNFASNLGGAVRQAATTAYDSSIINCTFVVNNAGAGGGAVSISLGTMALLNNIFTANGAGGNPGGHIGQAGGTINSLGHNLFGHLDGTTFTPDPSDRFGQVNNQLNTGVLIAFPFNNGGPTDTLPLVATSIAIDAGGATGAPPTDQRNFPRIGCTLDIGAFEVQTLTDTDADGVLNCLDTCPDTPSCASVDQTGCPADTDADGVPDGCDVCPSTIAGDPVSADGCSTADEDGDGVTNDADACRGTPSCAVSGVNSAGCPTDTDADGIFDGCDRCPGANDLTDTDVDGIPDCLDACPNIGDTDGDGVQDCQDGCPNDALKRDPGKCGCGQPDSDNDLDGIADCADQCPNTPPCASVDQTGCPTDGDGDGVPDGCDACPGTTAGDTVSTDGCSTADEDGDGVTNDADACRGTPACAIASVNASGCPADADADGVFDGCDQCPDANDLIDDDENGIPDCLVSPESPSTDEPAGFRCGSGALTPATLLLTAFLVRPRCGRRWNVRWSR